MFTCVWLQVTLCEMPYGSSEMSYRLRVTTCLENLEMSGNLKHVRDNVNSQGNVREKYPKTVHS